MPAQFRTFTLGKAVLAALGLVLSGCMPTNGTPSSTSSGSGSGSTTLSTGISGTSTIVSGTIDTYVINQVLIAANSSTTGTSSTSTSSTSSSSAYETQIFLNPTTSSANLLNDCTPASSSSGTSNCVCEFTWTDVNTTSGTAVNIPRQVSTSIDAVQQYALSCPAPAVYGTDITSGTTLSVTVGPASGATASVSFNTYNYTVGQATTITPANFQDSGGTPFANIARYTCYQQQQRGTVLTNAQATQTDPNTLANQGGNLGTSTYPLASHFCFYNADGTMNDSNSQDCPSFPLPDYTAQSYYYNLYIQQNAEGNINLGNGSFVCPQVKEALSTSSGNIGTEGKVWPLDTTFALSLTLNSSYTVGVAAQMVTSDEGDSVSQSVSCAQMANGNSPSTSPSSTPSSESSSNSPLVTSCLGFAAPAASNGTCPLVNGVQTYRLRRYYTLYPQQFDTSGCPMPGKCMSNSSFVSTPQPLDTIYVLDRPVVDPSNPGAVVTMLGPKPCPFAYFDNHGVVSGTNGYFSTSNSGWNGKNVDGLQFPNTDALNSGGTPSCSAALPMVDSTLTQMNVTTINAANPIGPGGYPPDSTRSLKQVFIRPTQSWAPHYVEDTSFQACAPLARPLVDPPLHFAKYTNNLTDNTTVTWCAEVYPSQNDNVNVLDPNNTGLIAPYTSHKPAATSIGCQIPESSGYNLTSIPASGYPSNGLANHLGPGVGTCDRTVLNPPGGSVWKRFPLLAPAPDVEAALQADNAYACSITSYNGNAPTKTSPSQGCCGTAVSVYPGTAVGGNSATGHLEPAVAPGATNCMVPHY